MKKNMGTIDKIVRISIALVLGVLCYAVVNGPLAYVLGAVSGIFIVTSLAGFCPLYTIFGIKTCGEECCAKEDCKKEEEAKQ